MASSKKGKKNKGKTLTLVDFLQETPGPVSTVPIRKSTLNWADEVEDNHDVYDPRSSKASVVLPTAPKASRDFDDIIDKVPQDPPFIAYLSNLPYDVDENEITYFFKNMKISNMRIPKDERTGEAPKLKGFGYVEFEDRDSLLNALVMADTTIKNRRIRIEIASDFDGDKRRSGRMDMSRDRGNRSDMSLGDWRSGPRTENVDTERPERRGFGRDREREDTSGAWRDGDRRNNREPERSFTRSSDKFSRDDRDSEMSRSRGDRDQEITRSRGDQEITRSRGDRDQEITRSRGDRDQEITRSRGDRDQEITRSKGDRDQEITRSARGMDRDQDYNRPRGGMDRDQDFNRARGGVDREDRQGFGPRRYDNDRGSRGGGFGRRDDTEPIRTGDSRQRPKLSLAPRTKPMEAASEPVAPSTSIFGNAKPVDTSVKEREIEQRLAKESDPPPRRDISRERRDTLPDKENQVQEEEKENDSVPEPDKEQGPKSDANGVVEKSHPPKKVDHEKKEYIKNDTGDKPKTDNRKREDKKEKEMPKVKKVDPPNFIASNKYAYLQNEDTSD